MAETVTEEATLKETLKDSILNLALNFIEGDSKCYPEAFRLLPIDVAHISKEPLKQHQHCGDEHKEFLLRRRNLVERVLRIAVGDLAIRDNLLEKGKLIPSTDDRDKRFFRGRDRDGTILWERPKDRRSKPRDRRSKLPPEAGFLNPLDKDFIEAIR